ncbi:MAG: hypothetical protein JXA78_12905 [Anaerolineales bacterium]|nr:hypothetical protein [Anaerolineales bacterium]
MNHIQIIKRSWQILWSYRTLWIFGVILALTSTSGQPGNANNNLQWGEEDAPSFPITPPEDLSAEIGRLNQWLRESAPFDFDTLISLAIALVCLALVMFVIFRIGYYVSQVALIRMVDGHETTGEKVSWRQGFRLGWSRPAWRLFLIDLSIFLPLVIGFIAMFGCAALPILLSIQASDEPTLPGIVATIGLAFIFIFLAILIGVTLSMLMHFIRRACVLGEAGVGQAIRQGWRLVRANLMDVFLMWLLMIGIRIGYAIATLPIVLLLIGLGALLGGGTGLLTHTMARLMAGDLASLIAAIAAGVSIFILTLALPMAFLQGLVETFASSAWTLAYRDIMSRSAPDLPTPAEIAEAT